jgi:hypothetical protein
MLVVQALVFASTQLVKAPGCHNILCHSVHKDPTFVLTAGASVCGVRQIALKKNTWFQGQNTNGVNSSPAHTIAAGKMELAKTVRGTRGLTLTMVSILPFMTFVRDMAIRCTKLHNAMPAANSSSVPASASDIVMLGAPIRPPIVADVTQCSRDQNNWLVHRCNSIQLSGGPVVEAGAH